MPNVFISHSHADIGFVGKLTKELLARGLNLPVSEQRPGPGEHWVKAIADDIREADNVLVVLSESTGSSEWVRAEIAMALSQGKKRIVPIFASRNPDVPFMLRTLQGIDLSDPEHYSRAVDQLADSLTEEDSPSQEDDDGEIDVRLFKAELERLLLEHERVSLERDVQLKTRLIAITCVCIATIAAAASVSFVLVGKLDDYGFPLGGVIGAVAGVAIVVVGRLISKSLRSVRMSK